MSTMVAMATTVARGNGRGTAVVVDVAGAERRLEDRQQRRDELLLALEAARARRRRRSRHG
jgi:hypothetical protein